MNPIVRSTATTLCVSLFGGLLASCAPRIDLAAERAAIQTVDSQMVSALNGRDLERWLSFLADDASMLPPNAPAVTGKSAIRTLLSELMAIPNFEVAHHPGTVEISRSGDLAYVHYSYELTIKASAGEAVMQRGKDVSVFKKQSDGSWKLLIDMWSSDEPPASDPGGRI